MTQDNDQNLKIALLEKDKEHANEKIADMEKRIAKLDDIYVRLSRYQIIEKIVFTLTLGTLGTVVGLVLKSGLIK